MFGFEEYPTDDAAYWKDEIDYFAQMYQDYTTLISLTKTMSVGEPDILLH